MRLEVDDLGELRPILEMMVEETLQQIREQEAQMGDRLGFPEAEAAAQLGLEPHVLRDARLRGEITARKVGRSWVYSRAALLRHLGEKRR